MAFIGYYFHWSYEELLSLGHRERQEWCRQISEINRELNQEPENMFAVPAGGRGR